MVKKARDCRGPVVMALADIGEFDDARVLMAMGADVVSLRGADPEFAQWLSQASSVRGCPGVNGTVIAEICGASRTITSARLRRS